MPGVKHIVEVFHCFHNLRPDHSVQRIVLAIIMSMCILYCMSGKGTHVSSSYVGNEARGIFKLE